MAVTYKENDYKNATILQVDFSRPELCAKTKPVSCSIRGKSVEPINWSWAQLLVAIVELFIKENNPYIHSLEENSLSQTGGVKRFSCRKKLNILTASRFQTINGYAQIIILKLSLLL